MAIPVKAQRVSFEVPSKGNGFASLHDGAFDYGATIGDPAKVSPLSVVLVRSSGGVVEKRTTIPIPDLSATDPLQLAMDRQDGRVVVKVFFANWSNEGKRGYLILDAGYDAAAATPAPTQPGGDNAAIKVQLHALVDQIQ